MEEIQWLEEERHLGELRPYEQNPRHITEKQYEKLKHSIQQDGYHARISITPDGRVIGGHQRLRAMKELGFTYVKVLVPDRDLSHEEYRRILIRDNVNNGQWDMDELASSFDLEELRDWGVQEVMDIAPYDTEDKSHEEGKSHMKCPECGSVFAAKGNKA